MGLRHKSCGVILTASPARKRQERRRALHHVDSGSSGDHRSCIRCKGRSDNCNARGCRKFRWSLSDARLRKYIKKLNVLTYCSPPRQYATDCVDVQVMVNWMLQAQNKIRHEASSIRCDRVCSFWKPTADIGLCGGTRQAKNQLERYQKSVASYIRRFWLCAL